MVDLISELDHQSKLSICHWSEIQESTSAFINSSSSSSVSYWKYNSFRSSMHSPRIDSGSWRVSDCAELVGVITGDDEVDIGLPKIYHQLVNVTVIDTATTIGLH